MRACQQVAQQLLQMESANGELLHNNQELRVEKDALQSQVTELQDAVKTESDSARNTEGDQKLRAVVAEFESKLVQVPQRLCCMMPCAYALLRQCRARTL